MFTMNQKQIVDYINQLDKKILISDETKKLLDTVEVLKKLFLL